MRKYCLQSCTTVIEAIKLSARVFALELWGLLQISSDSSMSATQAWVDSDLNSIFSVSFDVLLATTEKICCHSLWLLPSPTHDLAGHITVLCHMSHQPASGWMHARCSQAQASPPTDIKHDRENENGYLHVATFSRTIELAICVLPCISWDWQIPV